MPDEMRTLLEWAREVSRSSAIMRVEPPYTSTKELHDMIEADAKAHHRHEYTEVTALGDKERHYQCFVDDCNDHYSEPEE